MNHAIKLGRLSLQSPILCSSSGLSSVTGKKGVGSVRFVQVNSSGNDDPNKQSNFRNMDNNTNKKDEQQDNNLLVFSFSSCVFHNFLKLICVLVLNSYVECSI